MIDPPTPMDVLFSESGLLLLLADEIKRCAATFASDMMDAAELLFLAATLSLYPWERGGIVVEIGAYRGSTSAFMAKVLQHLGHRVPILSVDPFERGARTRTNVRGAYRAYLRTVRTHGVDDVCLPLVAFSKDAAPVVPDTVALLVVDGDHQHAAVRRDLDDYVPKVRPGGFVFVDDYVDAYPGVTQAVDEYFLTAPDFTIVHKGYFVVAQRR